MRISIVIAALVIALGCTAGGTADKTASQERIAQSPGKPLHPIQVRALVEGPIAAGVETDARIIVDSAWLARSIEVEIQPQLATVISANRFERHDGELARGKPVELPFRFQPAGDGPQPLKVIVRVTDTEGRVLVRELMLRLGDEKAQQPPQKPRDVEIRDLPEPAGDVVVPAEQEIRRGQ